jgi:hypothetical protein
MEHRLLIAICSLSMRNACMCKDQQHYLSSVMIRKKVN